MENAMNREVLSHRCPICRQTVHEGGSCTGEMPVSIVLLTIDERTPPQVWQALQTAMAVVERHRRRLSDS
jgi:hypothetical protein